MTLTAGAAVHDQRGPGYALEVAVTGDLSRYRTISRLGSGGMARVDLAEDTLLGRRVALKRLTGEADPRALSRLRREALAGASLSHPNLVSIYDVVPTAEGHLIIVMEYVEGETLRARLAREGRLPVSEALRILEGVAAGVDAIHRGRIVHRDVKPSNILLGNGTVKVADLGIASLPERTRITTSGSIVGSLSYMAPEQLQDAPATSSIDVYALAAVAYEILSGQKARREPNAVALAHAIATQPPPDLRNPWPQAPPAAAELLSRAMSPNPADRPRTAGELVRLLRAALGAGTAAPALAAAGSALPPWAAPRRATPPRRGTPPRGAPPRRTPPPGTPPPGTPPRPTGPAPAAATPALRLALPPQSSERRRRSRAGIAAAGALAAVAAAVVLAVVLGSGGPAHPAARSAAAAGRRSSPATSTPTKHLTATHRATARRRPPATKRSAARTGAASSSSSAAVTSTPATSTAQAPPASATTPTTAAPATVPAADSPVAAVESFYELAASHQDSSAWALADPALREELQGYAAFQRDQSGDQSITFRSARTVSEADGAATVAIATTSVHDDQTQQCTGTVDLMTGPSSTAWRLHQVHISCA